MLPFAPLTAVAVAQLAFAAGAAIALVPRKILAPG